ncbi:hypothetical protein B0H11DRAFT_2332038 [Mycena galericulata]|nr:hypothetical protein B0H11DRAFT_2332038 [Mycena galericulata]
MVLQMQLSYMVWEVAEMVPFCRHFGYIQPIARHLQCDPPWCRARALPVCGDGAYGGLSLTPLVYLRDNGYLRPASAILMSRGLPWLSCPDADLMMSCDMGSNALFDVVPVPTATNHMNPTPVIRTGSPAEPEADAPANARAGMGLKPARDADDTLDSPARGGHPAGTRCRRQARETKPPRDGGDGDDTLDRRGNVSDAPNDDNDDTELTEGEVPGSQAVGAGAMRAGKEASTPTPPRNPTGTGVRRGDAGAALRARAEATGALATPGAWLRSTNFRSVVDGGRAGRAPRGWTLQAPSRFLVAEGELSMRRRLHLAWRLHARHTRILKIHLLGTPNMPPVADLVSAHPGGAFGPASKKQLKEAHEKQYPGKWGINPGYGAFHEPKIDINVRDSLRRSSSVLRSNSTPSFLSVSISIPRRGRPETRPVMIHRAILGSLEQFIAIITEHFAGKWCLLFSAQ